MVTVALQVTLAPVVALKPAAGDHVYAVPPGTDADIVVVEPLQILALPTVVVTTGAGFTVNVAIALAEQPVTVFVPVTVTVLVTARLVMLVGVAITTDPVDADRFVAGVHTYVLAPPPVRVVLLPLHTEVGLADAVTVGRLLTVTVTVAVVTQGPADVPVTVYVLVTVPVNNGVALVLEDRLVAGFQL